MKISQITLGVFAVLLSAGTVQSGSGSVLYKLVVHSKVGFINDVLPNPHDEAASDKAVATLNFYRRFIPTGVWTIPPADPYTAKTLPPIKINSSHLKGTLELSNLVVVGAKEVSLKDVQVHLSSKRVDWEVTIPELKATVHAEFVNIDDGCFVFNISTDVSVLFKNFTAKGNLSVRPYPALGPIDAYELTGLNSTILADEVVYKSTVLDRCHKIQGFDVIPGISDSITKNFEHELNHALYGYTIEQVDRLVLPDDVPIPKQ